MSKVTTKNSPVIISKNGDTTLFPNSPVYDIKAWEKVDVNPLAHWEMLVEDGLWEKFPWYPILSTENRGKLDIFHQFQQVEKAHAKRRKFHHVSVTPAGSGDCSQLTETAVAKIVIAAGKFSCRGLSVVYSKSGNIRLLRILGEMTRVISRQKMEELAGAIENAQKLEVHKRKIGGIWTEQQELVNTEEMGEVLKTQNIPSLSVQDIEDIIGNCILLMMERSAMGYISCLDDIYSVQNRKVCMQMVYNTINAHRARSTREEQESEEDPIDSPVYWEDESLEKISIHQLALAMGGAYADYWYLYSCGYQQKEIAEKMGITDRQVRNIAKIFKEEVENSILA